METLDVHRNDGVVTVTLNRPERMNAINMVMFSELGQVLSDIARSDADRSVVFTGTGRAFCSGADMADMAHTAKGSPGKAQAMMRDINGVAEALYALPKPTVAAVNGLAIGAGMSLALGCDFVVASSDARFSAAFVKRGLSIDFGASWLLPRLIGLSAAKKLALLGDWVEAEEARQLGMVTELAEPEKVRDLANALAVRLATGPPVAMSMTKLMLNQSHGRSFAEALDQEALALAVNVGLQDTAEAYAAFVEKREPRFTGH